jgi:hypothetical protein
MFVYVLQHAYEPYEDDDEEEVKLIGVFSSEEKGQAAIAELCKLPGFERYPDNFHLDRYKVDEVGWSDGFVTIPRQ